MYDEEDLIPISALSQLYYCPRRAGLTLVEQQWSENVYTAEGAVLHERVHAGGNETRVDVRIHRGIRVRSLRLGLAGAVDCLELRLLGPDEEGGIAVDGAAGRWAPVPIEYKHGTTRDEKEYEIQLCAQAMCLEEMLSVPIGEGYLYYGESKRRLAVALNGGLRREVEEGALLLHEMLESGRTPPPQFSAKCRNCSLVNLCAPRLSALNAGRYLSGVLEETIGGSA
ncbi:MAG: CRISPR-associated protein Cas4 [Firmicutes bacterium]|jgi:CRISPR-associated exonuclease Cas4|nr:CRISPR-associated protein Cas4 [Bacillota bacterium]